MTDPAGPDLAALYGAYIDCLNARDWDRLGRFVHDAVRHNGRALGLSGYRAMLEQNVDEIPDLRFVVDLLVCEPPRVASRLTFDCAPRAGFMGLPFDGRRVVFSENVFYRFDGRKIVSVRSVVDKAALETQLR